MGTKVCPVSLVEGIEAEIPQQRFMAGSSWRLPSGQKPVIQHSHTGITSGKIRFLTIAQGVRRLSLSQVSQFAEKEKLKPTNVDHSYGMAKAGVGRQVLEALGRNPDETWALFCIGTTGFEKDLPAVRYYPLIIHAAKSAAQSVNQIESIQPTLSFLSENDVITSGIHCKWCIPMYQF